VLVDGMGHAYMPESRPVITTSVAWVLGDRSRSPRPVGSP